MRNFERVKDMASDKVVETVIVGNYVEMETEGKPKSVKNKLSNFFWHGGSVYDAWFSCASNQVRIHHNHSFLLLKTKTCSCFNFFFVCFRWLKFCLLCRTHFPSWECYLAYFSSSSTACLVAGQHISLACSM